MITPEQAAIIAENYLKKENAKYSEIASDKIEFEEDMPISYGKYENLRRNTYTVPYFYEMYDDPIAFFIKIDAETGEVFYTVGPHGYFE